MNHRTLMNAGPRLLLAIMLMCSTATVSPVSAAAAEYDPQVRVCPDGGYESGCDREDIDRAVQRVAVDAAMLAEQCLFRTQARCSPAAYGFFPKLRNGSTVRWQLMGIQPKDGPHIEMLVMIETPADGPPVVIAARQTEGWYGAPSVIDDSAELLLVHAPGRTGGSGAGNVDVLLTRHAQGWTTFDVNDLLEQASALLPEGFSLAGGANLNLREMHAFVPVKRKGDGGCCATGGMAHINFGLPRPNWMEVQSVTFEETAPVRTHRLTAAGAPGATE